MKSAQFWLKLVYVIGLLTCRCVCFQLYNGLIKVPRANYTDADPYYKQQQSEKDVIDDRRGKMTSEEDTITETPQPNSTPRNVVQEDEPSYSLVSSEIVVPDQSEIDEVDERTLKKEQAQLDVNNDGEIVTEVVQDDTEPTSSPVSMTTSVIDFQTDSVDNVGLINLKTESSHHVRKLTGSSTDELSYDANAKIEQAKDMFPHLNTSGNFLAGNRNDDVKQHVNHIPGGNASVQTPVILKQAVGSAFEHNVNGTSNIGQSNDTVYSVDHAPSNTNTSVNRDFTKKLNGDQSNFITNSTNGINTLSVTTRNDTNRLKSFDKDLVPNIDQQRKASLGFGSVRNNAVTLPTLPPSNSITVQSSGVPASEVKQSAATASTSGNMSRSALVENLDKKLLDVQSGGNVNGKSSGAERVDEKSSNGSTLDKTLPSNPEVPAQTTSSSGSVKSSQLTNLNVPASETNRDGVTPVGSNNLNNNSSIVAKLDQKLAGVQAAEQLKEKTVSADHELINEKSLNSSTVNESLTSVPGLPAPTTIPNSNGDVSQLTSSAVPASEANPILLTTTHASNNSNNDNTLILKVDKKPVGIQSAENLWKPPSSAVPTNQQPLTLPSVISSNNLNGSLTGNSRQTTQTESPTNTPNDIQSNSGAPASGILASAPTSEDLNNSAVVAKLGEKLGVENAGILRGKQLGAVPFTSSNTPSAHKESFLSSDSPEAMATGATSPSAHRNKLLKHLDKQLDSLLIHHEGLLNADEIVSDDESANSISKVADIPNSEAALWLKQKDDNDYKLRIQKLDEKFKKLREQIQEPHSPLPHPIPSSTNVISAERTADGAGSTTPNAVTSSTVNFDDVPSATSRPVYNAPFQKWLSGNDEKGLEKEQAIEANVAKKSQGTTLLSRFPMKPSSFRRMGIVHRQGLEGTKQSKTTKRLKTFLKTVKEMFKHPETVEDIMGWEAWNRCSKTCGQRAFRSRQRKCARLVKSDFDVACPEPIVQTQKCMVVPCSGHFSKEKLVSFLKLNDEDVHGDEGDDQKMIDQIFGKSLERPQVFPGSNDLVQGEGSSTADQNDVTTGFENSDDEENTARNAGYVPTGQKRYLYTVWGAWSACTRSCGQRSYAFRKRYCINAASGDIKKHCEKPTILAKKCKVKPCPVHGGLSSWSGWSSCSGDCGVMERHRSCTNPKPAYGGNDCKTLPVQVRMCGLCKDKNVAAQKSTSYSPKSLCGFDPCQRVGCLEDKGAICVTDFQCNPTFFNNEGSVLKECKDNNNVFLRPLAQKQCSFNPCTFTKCHEPGTKCLVDTKCRPFFVNYDGNKVECKGANVLQISSELICGFNPCTVTTCTVDPDAKCVTDYRCNPLFINTAGKIIRGCTEDEATEAERMTTETPSNEESTTANPTTRDETTPNSNLDYSQEYSKYFEGHVERPKHTPLRIEFLKNLEEKHLADIVKNEEKSSGERHNSSKKIQSDSRRLGNSSWKASGGDITLKTVHQNETQTTEVADLSLHDHEPRLTGNGPSSQVNDSLEDTLLKTPTLAKLLEKAGNHVDQPVSSFQLNGPGRSHDEEAGEMVDNFIVSAFKKKKKLEELEMGNPNFNDGLFSNMNTNRHSNTTTNNDISINTTDHSITTTTSKNNNPTITNINNHILTTPNTNENSATPVNNVSPITTLNDNGATTNNPTLPHLGDHSITNPTTNHPYENNDSNATISNPTTEGMHINGITSKVNTDSNHDHSLTNLITTNPTATNPNASDLHENSESNPTVNNPITDHMHQNSMTTTNEHGVTKPATDHQHDDSITINPSTNTNNDHSPANPTTMNPTITSPTITNPTTARVHDNSITTNSSTNTNNDHSPTNPTVTNPTITNPTTTRVHDNSITTNPSTNTNNEHSPTNPTITNPTTTRVHDNSITTNPSTNINLPTTTLVHEDNTTTPTTNPITTHLNDNRFTPTGRLPENSGTSLTNDKTNPNTADDNLNNFNDNNALPSLNAQLDQTNELPSANRLIGNHLYSPPWDDMDSSYNHGSNGNMQSSANITHKPSLSTSNSSVLENAKTDNPYVYPWENYLADMANGNGEPVAYDDATTDKMVSGGNRTRFYDLDEDFNETRHEKSAKGQSTSGYQGDVHLVTSQRPLTAHTNVTSKEQNIQFIKQELSKAIENELANLNSAGLIGVRPSSRKGAGKGGDKQETYEVHEKKGDGKGGDKQGIEEINDMGENHGNASPDIPIFNDSESDGGGSLKEIKDFLNEQDSKIGDFGEGKKTPEVLDKNQATVEAPNGFKISLTPDENQGDTEGNGEEYGITSGNSGSHVQRGVSTSKEPEFKDSYSPALNNEIKELGLDEYYIKDGFEQPKHKKVENARLRHVLRTADHPPGSHFVKVDYDPNRPVDLHKKFHMSPGFVPDRDNAAFLRKHDDNGDEIERVPVVHPAHDVAERSRTAEKNIDVSDDDLEDNGAPLGEAAGGHANSLGRYLNEVRKYVGNMDGGLFANRGEKDSDGGLDSANDFEDALVLDAKDDGSNPDGDADIDENLGIQQLGSRKDHVAHKIAENDGLSDDVITLRASEDHQGGDLQDKKNNIRKRQESDLYTHKKARLASRV